MALATVHAARRYDMLYTRSPWVAVVATLLRKTCVYEVHAPGVPRLENAFMRRVLKSNKTLCVAISQRLADIVAERYRLDSGNLLVEHDAYDPELFSHSDSANSAARSRLKAVYAGSFYVGRGIELIVELARRCPRIEFVAIGGTLAEIRDSVASVPDNLSLLPRVTHAEVAHALADADILLMPYGRRVTIAGRGDTAEYCSPLKMFEYLGAGRAILSSFSPSIAEVLTDGVNALLLPPDNVDAWEVALLRVASNTDLRQSLGTGALATAVKHTWAGRARRVIAAAEQGASL